MAKGKVRRGVSAVFARVVHAALEGAVFVYTTDGFRAFLMVNTAALLWALGPKKTVVLGIQCSLACSAARFCVVLAGSTKKGDNEQTLRSIWDFEPPGDLGESGAWTVLKELAMTMTEGVDGHEELTGLEPIPVHELAMRLMLLYKHRQEHPAVDSITEEDVLGPVSPETVELLCRYLYYADQAYDCGTEDSLKQLLSEDGYDLNFAKLESTWAQHHPAYFVATHQEEKELLITVRGTAQIEDVVTDLTAYPRELGDTGHLVHGGIYASALWLTERLLSLAQAMQDAGFRVTLVGHSLGAGAAALMALMFKAASVSNVTCYAFATPNCVDLALADECSGYVTSVVFRDDIVARFSPESLALLHRELTEFDLEPALQKAREGDDMLLRFVAFLGKFTTIEDVQADEAQPKPGPHEGGSPASSEEGHSTGGKGNEDEEGELKVSEQQANTYRPHIPGRVLYIYRSEADGDEEHTQHEMAFVKSTCKALRCIRLSEKVIKDHLIDSYFMGFGRPNPSKARQAAEKEEEEERPDDGANEEKQREQSAEDRDKEEKDKWRSWKAKLGLVSG